MERIKEPVIKCKKKGMKFKKVKPEYLTEFKFSDLIF